MAVTIEDPVVTTTSVAFAIAGLDPSITYFFTINDVATEAQVAHGPVPPRVAKALTTRIDVTDELDGIPAGEYELRIYDGAAFGVTTGAATGAATGATTTGGASAPARTVPKPGSVPVATQVFRFLPAPAADSGPGPSRLVRLERSASEVTSDTVLWDLIRTATGARQFRHYQLFIDANLCRAPGGAFAPRAFDTLVDLTRRFVADAGVPIVDIAGRLAAYQVNGNLPYIDNVIARYPDALSGDPCSDIDPSVLEDPFPVELIWSYYMEEGGLAQTLNHILAKFQNRFPGGGSTRSPASTSAPCAQCGPCCGRGPRARSTG